MLIVILLVGVLIIGLGILIASALDCEEVASFFCVLGLVILIITLIAILSNGIKLSERGILDEKIEMYQQENQVIQDEISQAVENYMQYETDTYSKIKTESPITLVTMFPELKADELVVKQIEVYIKNNKEIKNLKEQKLDNRVLAWWLYFGK